jgi:hypothetical protein
VFSESYRHEEDFQIRTARFARGVFNLIGVSVGRENGRVSGADKSCRFADLDSQHHLHLASKREPSRIPTLVVIGPLLLILYSIRAFIALTCSNTLRERKKLKEWPFLLLNRALTVGWSIKCCPTPGRSCLTGTETLVRCSAGPMPDNSRICTVSNKVGET